MKAAQLYAYDKEMNVELKMKAYLSQPSAIRRM